MELGIQGRMNQPPLRNNNQQKAVQLIQPEQSEVAKEAAAKAERNLQRTVAISKEEMDRHIRRILQDASLFNRDLRYSINRETNEVIVKVVDKTTDKVIKEIPPEALQRLQIGLKRQLGLLIDEKI
ncbi:MAG: flagellar protein FlaG [Spirochaetaceae bacterium]|nr:flagellar protein FlaG [Spirochaetaceae bacterium]